MSGNREYKPGWMGRAVAAWVILNIILVASVGAFVALLAYFQVEHAWYTIIPLILIFAVGEIAIMSETIAPVLSKLKEWIFQDEYIDRDKGEKPSWEKKQ